MRKVIFVLGWILIAIGILGVIGTSLEIPQGARKVNDYSFVQDLENGQKRLTICSRPFKMPFFTIHAPLADRRVVIHYYYPDQHFSNEIISESNTGGNSLIIGYCEFDLREFNILSLTSAELYFKAFSNAASPNDKVGIYLTENITGNLSWNNPLAKGNLQKQVTVTSGSPFHQEFEFDVTSATQAELNYDEIVTFGFYPESNNCLVQIVTDSSQIWPILTIDYTPSGGTGGTGSTGGSTNNDSNQDSNSDTDSGANDLDGVLPPDDTDTDSEILKWWPYISITVGIIMAGWSSGGRFFR